MKEPKVYMMFLSFLFHVSLLLSSIINALAAAANHSDHLALLAFKDKISEVSSGALNSWNESISYCEWQGITCSRRHPQRVTVLDLESQYLQGTLSPYIGNLSFLRTIRLTLNYFHGPIPQEIGHLLHLEQLYLDQNLFDGEIPASLSGCSDLKEINLRLNKLSGGIPVELNSLQKLTILYLSQNELVGNIPPWLGNLSSLTTLSLASNSFTGNIPADLCRIKSCTFLQVGSNNLTGIIPPCLYNLSQITIFSVSNNQLDGSLPPDIHLTLPNLQELYVGSNNFKGFIPLSLTNASNLEVISLELNSFAGPIPRDLGRLQGLRVLSLYSNQLGTTSGDDLNFIDSLTNCTNLYEFSISVNFLKGSIPHSVGNLSTKLDSLFFRKNQIDGSIPVEITNLVNLTILSLGYNYLEGEIPELIGTFPLMREIYLNPNQLSGRIPDFCSNSSVLSILNLSRNELHGDIPLSLGNCENMDALVLSENKLTGTLPKQVISLSSFKIVLNLSNNGFTGSLPSEVGNLSSLQMLDISNNRLSGLIPDTLGNCLTLETLYMEGNLFEGSIPQSLSALRGLKELDLSHNNLSGQIPKYLVNFTSLTSLNLSYNSLDGPVPKDGVFANASAISIVGNSKLCGGVTELKLIPCPLEKKGKYKKGKNDILKVIIPVILASLSLFLILCICMIYRRRMQREQLAAPSVSNHHYARVSYTDLLKGTNGFSSDNLIGVGSYGSVYKGVLDQVNTIVAVKVLNLERQGASRSFLSECNALRNLRHRNLLKIVTSCSSVDFQGNEFKALVFEYMPNGSLDDWLHEKRDVQQQSRILDFSQRLNIAIDVASAMDYLHHHCKPTIVHCDLKPSNVLLDDDMVAHVADFGLSKIFSPTSYDDSLSQASSFAVKGSIGYVAPEYGMGREVSKHGDIYSYGILLLEMFTGKRPTDDIFQDGRNLHDFAKMALSGQVMNIADPKMPMKETDETTMIGKKNDGLVRMQECLVSVLRLGVSCCAESPNERADMGEAVIELHRIRDHYQGVRIHLK